MNPKRLVLAIVVAFVAIWITDFLIHGVWLANTYKATAALWRPEVEMQQHIGWLFCGQFLAALTFVVLWAKGPAPTAQPFCAAMYGLFMGMFNQATTVVTYAVQPFPAGLAVKWFLAGTAQGVLIGLIVFFVYKPKPAA